MQDKKKLSASQNICREQVGEQHQKPNYISLQCSIDSNGYVKLTKLQNND